MDFFTDFLQKYRDSLLERPIWMRVNGGQFQDKKNMIQFVQDKGCLIDIKVFYLIFSKEWKLLDRTEQIDLIEITVRELTGKEKAKIREIYEVCDRIGFRNAPDETAFLVQMGYQDYPENEKRFILSKPKMHCSYINTLLILCIGRDAQHSWISSTDACPDSFWPGETRLLLCRRSLTI